MKSIRSGSNVLPLCRYGGLGMVKQKGNYGKKTFHSAPERFGHYAFIYPFIEMFLAASTKENEIKHGVYKKYHAIDGFIWTHLKPSAKDIIDFNGSWYKTHVSVVASLVRKCYAVDSGFVESQYGYPSRSNPYSITTKDHLEVFVCRDTVIK